MEVALTKNTIELERLEGIITRNLQSFYEVGRALMEIRDGELYREVLGYETFEEYCKKRWDFTDRYARYILASSKAIDNIGGTIVPPESIREGQIRPLTKLPAEQQREAWAKAVESAPDGSALGGHPA